MVQVQNQEEFQKQLASGWGPITSQLKKQRASWSACYAASWQWDQVEVPHAKALMQAGVHCKAHCCSLSLASRKKPCEAKASTQNLSHTRQK